MKEKGGLKIEGKEKRVVPEAGDWMSAGALTGRLKANRTTIHKKALDIAMQKHKLAEWIEDRRKANRITSHYHPDLIALLCAEFSKVAGDWVSANFLIKKLKSRAPLIHEKAVAIAKRENMLDKWIEYRRVSSRSAFVYHPDLVALLESENPKDAGTWSSPISLQKELKMDRRDVNDIAVAIATREGKLAEWIEDRKEKRGPPSPHYHPDLTELLLSEIFFQKSKQDWVPLNFLESELRLNRDLIHDKACLIAKDEGNLVKWVDERKLRNGRVLVRYHPDLIHLLREYFRINHDLFETEQEKKKRLKKKFEDYVKGVVENESDLAESELSFKKLISIFGSSYASVLLYELRPDFKSIPIDHVKRILAEYLGQYLTIKYTFSLKDVSATAKFLSNPSLRQAVFENIKADCVRFYFEERKNGSRANAHEVIYNYLVRSLDELGSGIPKLVEDVILEVMDYYTSATRDFHKPEKFVDKLSEGRDFPDLHQRINMKELKDKKRMLIADEMGLGKSASVIMAKEQMNLGCALVVVPGSVIRLGTWQNYLCDDPERKGYFRSGTAPRVLVVESAQQLENIKKSDYDYILISHERLNGRYAHLIADLDPDMLIVDEVHKLKDLKGVRSRALMPLINKLGSDKYLALLSGTPIPNKVRDIAFALKLLYPEQFGSMQDGDLVKTIIQSSADEILKLLIPRMQMKELEDVVEMPSREQKIIDVKLSKIEADIYEGLFELDELTAKEKMGVLRKFLMNPALLDSTPVYEGSKVAALRLELQKIFETKSKVIVFVNEYTTGILRGEKEITAREKLGLPDDVSIEHFYGGEENVKRRAGIQHRFNNTPERMVVFISGKTSDVGNSFVAAEETLVYSEPWTEADLRQQLARVFRPGLDHDIVEKIFVVDGTIERGIHEYIRHKYKIIEKVLKGIPTTELEQRLLKKSENQHDDAGAGEHVDFEVNPELARDYFSWKQKLDNFFGHTKENGEERIVEFLKQWGSDYAKGYQEMGARSYQSNVNRVSGSLIGEMFAASGRNAAAIQILDIASGPEMLRRHIGTKLQPSVSSVDINAHHFAHSTSGKTRVASWTDIPCKPRSVDYVNCAMAFQDSSFAPSRGMFERVNVLREMNRVLKVGGRAVISMIYSMRMADMEKFKVCAAEIGFKIVDDFSGLATHGENFESQVITLEKFADCEKKPEQVVESVGAENIVGLKFAQAENKKLKKPRKVMRGFYMNNKLRMIDLNDADLSVVREEEEAERHVQSLCKQYGSVKNIPADEVVKNKYVRVFVYGKYHLFKRLTSAPGVLVLNENTT